MKNQRNNLIDIPFGILFEAFLLSRTLPSGNMVAAQVILCGIFFGACAYVCIKKPWKDKALGEGPALLLQILFSTVVAITTLDAGDYIPTLGPFAVVPANLALLAACLVGPLANRHKEERPGPESSES